MYQTIMVVLIRNIFIFNWINSKHSDIKNKNKQTNSKQNPSQQTTDQKAVKTCLNVKC